MSCSNRLRWTSGVAVALCALSACADVVAPPNLPPPVAGLAHPAVVRARIPVIFDANPTRIAVVKDRPDLSARVQQFKFAVADGSPAVYQASPQWSHTFAQPGNYDVAMAVWDDRGGTSDVQSRLLVVADLAEGCTGTVDAACDSGLCATGACVRIACAGAVACDIVGGGASCTAGQCLKSK